MHWLANRIKDLLFPKFCAGCGEEGNWLCAACFQKIDIFKTPAYGEDKAVANLDVVTALFDYGENTVSKLIQMFKYNYITEIADVFEKIIFESVIPTESADERRNPLHSRSVPARGGSALGGKGSLGYARDDNWQGFTIIPVPLHLRRERERGFNQSEIIAELFAKKFALEVNKNLRRVIYTVQQVKLSGEERRANLKNAFDFRQNGQAIPEKVLLVDDVFTTGATMQECAKVLKNNGVKVVWGLALARG